MPKATRSKQAPSQPAGINTTKFVIGAIVGTGLGFLAINASFTAALITLAGLLVAAAYVFYVTRRRHIGKPTAGPLLGALVVGVTAVSGVQYLGTSLAWHPKGNIKKTVQNVTANGPISDANDAASAIVAKPGDILNYTVTVSNIAPNAKRQYNDLAFVTINDTLPDGVQLVTDPAARTFTDNYGTILPGKSVSKSYQAKVVTNTDGLVQQNVVCYTGDSVVKDAPQKGCDPAFTRVAVAPAPPAATPVEQPIEMPTQLPATGPSNVIIIALIAIVTGYLFSAVYNYLSGNRRKS